MKIELPTPSWQLETESRWTQDSSYFETKFADESKITKHKYYLRHIHFNNENVPVFWTCNYRFGNPYQCSGCWVWVPEEVLGFLNLCHWSLEGE